MIPVNSIHRMHDDEITATFGPIFAYSLAEAPVQEREALVDSICTTLLAASDTARIGVTPQAYTEQR